MDGEAIKLSLAIATFFVLYTVTILGGAAWLQNLLRTQLKELKTEILTDFNSKHDANSNRYEALNTLVQRHDVLLSPEFSGRKNGGHHVKS